MGKTYRHNSVRNRFAEEQRADKIRNWYHSRGYTQVKVWVEETSSINDFGTSMPADYCVRMSYVPDIEQLKQGNLIG